MTIRFIWAILTWVIYIACDIPFIVAGLALVPLAIAFRQVIPSPIDGKPIVTAPNWLWLYGNDEEGYHEGSTFWQMYRWAAIRNPVNNSRFIRWLNPPPVPSKIRTHREGNWYLCWQGMLYHFYYEGPRFSFSIGWKYEPDHAIEVTGWQTRGVGFALRVIRK